MKKKEYNQIEQSGGSIFGKSYPIANPQWPPTINSKIAIKTHNYKDTFIGIPIKLINKGHAAVILLLNNTDYIDPYYILNGGNKNNKKTSDKNGILILLPQYQWEYISDEKFYEIFRSLNDKHSSLKIMTNKIKDGYDRFIRNLKKGMYNNIYIEGGNNGESKKNNNNLSYKEGIYDTLNINKTGVEGIDNDHTIKPIIVKPTSKKSIPTNKEKKILMSIINNSENVKDIEKVIVINENVAIKNLIIKKRHEMDEGDKIIRWLNNRFNIKHSPIRGLKYSIHNGYVHISRVDLPIKDIITRELLQDKKLTYFKWQLNRPIYYDTLKYVLFQNDFQKGISHNIKQQKEAELILSQEYIIALQPQPVYQLFCLKRLIFCWYADDNLEKNIRKIKVLINQYRAKNDAEYNKKYGVLPSIVIYPRYGYKSARIVNELLSKYFAYYITLGWQNSDPHYFRKKDELMYDTNGSIDLKLYFQNVINESKSSLKNDSFNFKYTRLNKSKNIYSELL